MNDHQHHHGHRTSAPAEPGFPQHGEKHAGNPGHGAHDKHAGHSVAMFRDKFWISLLLTIPTLVWGHMLPRALGYTPPGIPGAHWIAPVFGTVVFLYGGLVFLQGAIRELRDRLPGMMTLIALAISVAFVFSTVVTLGYPGMPLWEELATLVTIMLLGHWIEMRSISQAQGALGELAKLLPNTAVRLRGQDTEEIPVGELREGDLVLVRPGASIPADGEVLEGSSDVNESMITGESRPVTKRAQDRVIAGTVNGAGSLRVRVTGTGDRTALAGIMRLVEQAQSSRSRAQALADRAAFWLTLVALGAGTLAFVGWIAAGADAAFAVERLVTTLVIASPHALGLAIPLVIAISTTLGARSGLLVRDRRGLEEARTLTAVVFDKTGTLTRGEFGVVGITTADGLREDEALRLAASAEVDSEHTIAQGIVRSARERQLDVPRADRFQSLPGIGVQARVGGRSLLMGGPALLRSRAVRVPPSITDAAEQAARRGQAAVFLAEETDGTASALAAFTVADVVRPESRQAIQALHDEGIEVVMLTGDSGPVASRVRFVEPGESGRVQIVLEETRQRTLSGDMDDASIRTLLLRAARESSDPGVRVETMDLFKGQPQSQDVRRALLHALRQDANAGVRLKALDALRPSAGDPDVRQVLAEVLLKDDNPGVRTQAVDLLTQKREPELVGVLQELMTRENNNYVRMKCQRVLADMNASAETF